MVCFTSKNKRCIVFFLSIFSLFNIQFSHAKSEEISVCYDGWPPYYYHIGENRAGGVIVTLLNEIATENGYEIKYKILPFKRCLKQVYKGKIDILMVTGGELDNALLGKTALATWQISAIVHKDYPKNYFTRMEEFMGKKVIQIQEYDYPKKIRDFSQNWTVSKVGYFNGNDTEIVPYPFKMIENGQASVFLEDAVFSEKIIRDNELDLKVLKPAIDVEHNFLAYSLGREDLYRVFENGLEQRAQDGRLDQLYLDLLGKSWVDFGNKEVWDRKLF